MFKKNILKQIQQNQLLRTNKISFNFSDDKRKYQRAPKFREPNEVKKYIDSEKQLKILRLKQIKLLQIQRKQKQEEEKYYQSKVNIFINYIKIDISPLKNFLFQSARYLMIGGVLYFIYNSFFNYQEDQIYEEDFFQNYVAANLVKSVNIQNKDNKIQAQVNVKFISLGIESTQPKELILKDLDSFLSRLEFTRINNNQPLIPVKFQFQQNQGPMNEVLVNGLILGGIFYVIIKSGKGLGLGGDIMGFGRTKVQAVTGETMSIRFSDVAGQKEAKTEISEFVDFLKNPQKYNDLGARLPRGALLAGPPGTGKTLLAKACAGEAGVPFFYISGSQFVEMFVGVGASRVRDLFKQAKQKSPSIIFIDEIDAIGKKRQSKLGGGDERDTTLNQLLVEMDGFGTNQNVIVMAATNRAELLDAALTRPGRFDRTIDVQLPDIEGRKQIILVHLKNLNLNKSKTIEEYAKRLASLTPGFSGADLANLCNEGAILAARHNKETVDSLDFEASAERVMAGLEKKKLVNEKERKTVAYHESGHAVVSWFLAGGSPLVKITIVPRTKGSLGYAQYLPNEGALETKEELFDRICVILGGRCVEQKWFNEVTTGAYDDLNKAYDLAFSIVARYGMSDKIGYVGFTYDDMVKKYSDQTQKIIDDEIKIIIDKAQQKTIETINKYEKQIEELSQALLKHESLDLKQIVQILGERPFKPKKNFAEYLEIKNEEEEAEKDKQNQENNENQDQPNLDLNSIKKDII